MLMPVFVSELISTGLTITELWPSRSGRPAEKARIHRAATNQPTNRKLRSQFFMSFRQACILAVRLIAPGFPPVSCGGTII